MFVCTRIIHLSDALGQHAMHRQKVQCQKNEHGYVEESLGLEIMTRTKTVMIIEVEYEQRKVCHEPDR